MQSIRKLYIFIFDLRPSCWLLSCVSAPARDRVDMVLRWHGTWRFFKLSIRFTTDGVLCVVVGNSTTVLRNALLNRNCEMASHACTKVSLFAGKIYSVHTAQRTYSFDDLLQIIKSIAETCLASLLKSFSVQAHNLCQ